MGLMRLVKQLNPSSRKSSQTEPGNLETAADERLRSTMVARADALRDQRSWQEAVDAYAQVLEYMPGDAGLRVQYGHMLKESGQSAEAVAAYLKAAELAPDDADPVVHLAHLLKRLDDPRTKEAFERVKALSKDPRILAEADEELQILTLKAAAQKDNRAKRREGGTKNVALAKQAPAAAVESRRGQSRGNAVPPPRFTGRLQALRGGRIVVGRARDSVDEKPVRVAVRIGEREIDVLACHRAVESGRFEEFQFELPGDVGDASDVQAVLPDGTILSPPADWSDGGVPESGLAFVDAGLAGGIRGWIARPRDQVGDVLLQLDGALAGQANLDNATVAGAEMVAFHLVPPQIFFDGRERTVVVQARIGGKTIELACLRKAFSTDDMPALRWGEVAFEDGVLQGTIYGAPQINLAVVLSSRDFPCASTFVNFDAADLSAGFGRGRFRFELANLAPLDLDGDPRLHIPAFPALEPVDLLAQIARATARETTSGGSVELSFPFRVSGIMKVDARTRRGFELQRQVTAQAQSRIKIKFGEAGPDGSEAALTEGDEIASVLLFGSALGDSGETESTGKSLGAVAMRSLLDPVVQMALRAGGGTTWTDGCVNVCGAWGIVGEVVRGWAANLSSLDEKLVVVLTTEEGGSVAVTADAQMVAAEAGLAQPLPCGFAVPLARLLAPGQRARISLSFEGGEPFGPPREVVRAKSSPEHSETIDRTLQSEGPARALLHALALPEKPTEAVAQLLVLDGLMRDRSEDPGPFYETFENVLGVTEIRRALAGFRSLSFDASAADRLAAINPDWLSGFSGEARAALAGWAGKDEPAFERRARWFCIRQALKAEPASLLRALEATKSVDVEPGLRSVSEADASASGGDLAWQPAARELWPVLAWLSQARHVVLLPDRVSRLDARRLLLDLQVDGSAGEPAIPFVEFPVSRLDDGASTVAGFSALTVIDLREERPDSWIEPARLRLAALAADTSPDQPVVLMSPSLAYDDAYASAALRAFERAGRRSTAFAAMNWNLRIGAPQLESAADHATIARIDYAVWRAGDLATLDGDLPLAVPLQAMAVTSLAGAAVNREELERRIAEEISDADLDLILHAERRYLLERNRVPAVEAAAALPSASIPEAVTLTRRLIALGRPDLAHHGLKRALDAPTLFMRPIKEDELASIAVLSRQLSVEAEFAAAFCPHAPHLARSCPGSLIAVGESLAATLEPNALAGTLLAMLQGVLASKGARPIFRAFELIARYCTPMTMWTALVQIDDSRPTLLSDAHFARVVGTMSIANDISPELKLRNCGLSVGDFLVFAEPPAALASSLRAGDAEAVKRATTRFFASGRGVREFASLTRTHSVELGTMGLRCDELVDPARFDARERLLAAVLMSDRAALRALLPALAEGIAVEDPLYLAAQTRLDDFSGFNRVIARMCTDGGVEPIVFGTGGLATVFGKIAMSERERPARSRAGRVAVICSVFNPDLDLMREVMRSLAAQTYADLDIMVIDDCSNEIEPEVIREAALLDERFRFHRMTANSGPYECRNWAIRHSDAPFVAINDCDDFAHPQKIETQIATMTRDSHVRLSTTAHVRLDYQGRPQLEHTLDIFGDGPMTSVFHRSLFDRFGLFAPVRSRGDVEFRERVRNWAGAHSIHHDPTPLMYCLATPQSLSNTAASTRGQYLALLRDTFMKRAELLALGVEAAGALPLTVPVPLRPTSSSL